MVALSANPGNKKLRIPHCHHRSRGNFQSALLGSITSGLAPGLDSAPSSSCTDLQTLPDFGPASVVPRPYSLPVASKSDHCTAGHFTCSRTGHSICSLHTLRTCVVRVVALCQYPMISEQHSSKLATICPTNWTVDGSVSKGRTMANRQTRLTMRAFNNVCEAAIANTRWNNVVAMEKRILNSAKQLMALTLQ